MLLLLQQPWHPYWQPGTVRLEGREGRKFRNYIAPSMVCYHDIDEYAAFLNIEITNIGCMMRHH